MSRLKRRNVVSFWRQSPQTSKDSAHGNNQKWRGTNVNLREISCLKYLQASYPIASASAELRPYTIHKTLLRNLSKVAENKCKMFLIWCIKRLMSSSSRASPHTPRTLPLWIIKIGRKQMKTCAKFCFSTISRPIPYAISFGRTTSLSHS